LSDDLFRILCPWRSLQLAAAPAGVRLAGWSGACTAHRLLDYFNGPASVTALFNVTKAQDIQALNPIIFMAQENRGFGHYFGASDLYRAAHGYGAATDIDGLTFDPQGVAQNTNPNFDRTGRIQSFHLILAAWKIPSPSWKNPMWTSTLKPMSTTALLDGFVFPPRALPGTTA